MALPMESRLHGAAVELNAPYVAEMVRSEMLKRYGEDTYTAGYQVVTALDSRLQKAANYSLRNGLLEFTRRRGYRGPIAQVDLPTRCWLLPLDEWPTEILEPLEQYAPGGLSLALVTAVSKTTRRRSCFATADSVLALVRHQLGEPVYRPRNIRPGARNSSRGPCRR